jgi:hypothetical protein
MSVLFSVYAPGSISASNYVSICDKAVGDTLFLYEHLIRNKIVPERWFTFDELSISFSSGSGRYILYRRKPKKEVMILRAIRGYTTFTKTKKTKTAFGDAFAFVPIRLDEVVYRQVQQGPLGIPDPPGIDEPQEVAERPPTPAQTPYEALLRAAERLQHAYPNPPEQAYPNPPEQVEVQTWRARRGGGI